MKKQYNVITKIGANSLGIKKKIKNSPYLYKLLVGIWNGAIHGVRFIVNVYLYTFLFWIIGFLRICHIPPFWNRYRKIEQYKNAHKGSRCFIVATGPSITVEDVENLKGEITIGLNTIYRIFDKTSWRPTYYMCGDYKFLGESIVNEANVDELSIKQTFLTHPAKKYVNSNKKITFIPTCWLDHWYNLSSKWFMFSKNLLFGMYDFYTVTNCAVTLAAYMGITEIYLIGVDCNYSGVNGHVNETNSQKLSDDNKKVAENMQLLGYRRIIDFLKKYDIKVYNATRGGKLELFDRVSLDDVLNHPK